MLSRASSYLLRRSPSPGPAYSGSGGTMPFQGTPGAKRSAVSEDLVPATAPATKLHKDTNGDVRTAATVTAAAPTDAAGTTPAAQPLVQLTQVVWQAFLARVTVLEQLLAQLTEVQSQLKAAEASFRKKLEEQTQSSLARGNAVKDSCQQRIKALDSTAEMLSQRIRFHQSWILLAWQHLCADTSLWHLLSTCSLLRTSVTMTSCWSAC